MWILPDLLDRVSSLYGIVDSFRRGVRLLKRLRPPLSLLNVISVTCSGFLLWISFLFFSWRSYAKKVYSILACSVSFLSQNSLGPRTHGDLVTLALLTTLAAWKLSFCWERLDTLQHIPKIWKVYSDYLFLRRIWWRRPSECGIVRFFWKLWLLGQ